MKRILIIVFCLILFSFIFTLTTGDSLVVPFGNANEMKKIDCENGKINPFKNYDFSTGDWEMYIVLSSDDKNNLPKKVKQVNCFKTSDTAILKEIKETWNFDCKGSDIATVDSDLYLLQNGKIVFSSGLMLNKSQEGLQSEKFGWIFSKDFKISEKLKTFDRVYLPIILL